MKSMINKFTSLSEMELWAQGSISPEKSPSSNQGFWVRGVRRQSWMDIAVASRFADSHYLQYENWDVLIRQTWIYRNYRTPFWQSSWCIRRERTQMTFWGFYELNTSCFRQAFTKGKHHILFFYFWTHKEVNISLFHLFPTHCYASRFICNILIWHPANLPFTWGFVLLISACTNKNSKKKSKMVWINIDVAYLYINYL